MIANQAPSTEGNPRARELLPILVSGIDGVERAMQSHSVQGIAVLTAAFLMVMGAHAVSTPVQSQIVGGASLLFFVVANGTLALFWRYHVEYKRRLSVLRDTLQTLLHEDAALDLLGRDSSSAAAHLRPVLGVSIDFRLSSFLAVTVILVFLAFSAAFARVVILDTSHVTPADSLKQSGSGTPSQFPSSMRVELCQCGGQASSSNQASTSATTITPIQVISGVVQAATPKNATDAGKLVGQLLKLFVDAGSLDASVAGDLKKAVLGPAGEVVAEGAKALLRWLAPEKSSDSPAASTIGWAGNLVVNCGANRSSNSSDQRAGATAKSKLVKVPTSECGELVHAPVFIKQNIEVSPASGSPDSTQLHEEASVQRTQSGNGVSQDPRHEVEEQRPKGEKSLE